MGRISGHMQGGAAGGEGGADGGGVPGGGGGVAGGAGGGGVVGGARGWVLSPAQNVPIPERPDARVKLWSVHPTADHLAPFQPSPYESYISRVQVPGGTTCVAE